MVLLKIITVLLLAVAAATSYRILAVFPAPSYSHYASGIRILKELARRGHEVTVINPSPQKTPLKNFRDINLKVMKEHFEERRKTMNFFDIGDGGAIMQELLVNSMVTEMTETMFAEPEVQKFLASPTEKFDLVIVEDFFTYSLKAFAYHFKAPLVSFSSVGVSRFIQDEIGNPSNPSYITDIFLTYTENMSFFQRVHNSFIYIFAQLHKHLVVLPKHNAIVQKYFPGAPDIAQLNYNVSLALVNSHVSTHQAIPHVPVVVDVGGVHVNPPQKLPKDLQDFLDSAHNGAIYFSMGSNLRSADIPEEKRNALLEVFKKLKLKVLWKWEEDNLPGKPENVLIKKWVPQTDVLAHPNVKIFISHGGLLSTIEAVYHGVPIIGIPVYGDQKMNIANVVNHGFALSVPFAELSQEKLSGTIDKMLKDARYAENAKRRSKIMHDQPVDPLDKAVFWIEYVVRHQGAPHLRVSSLNLAWYQYLLLDVVAFVAVVALVLAASVCCVIRKVCCKSRKQSKATVAKSGAAKASTAKASTAKSSTTKTTSAKATKQKKQKTN